MIRLSIRVLWYCSIVSGVGDDPGGDVGVCVESLNRYVPSPTGVAIAVPSQPLSVSLPDSDCVHVVVPSRGYLIPYMLVDGVAHLASDGVGGSIAGDLPLVDASIWVIHIDTSGYGCMRS